MYVLGHIGISLLLFAPIAAALLAAGHVGIAVLTGALMVVFGPLPDLDEYTDRIDHRGPTHTVWFAGAVGLGVGLGAFGIATVSTSLGVDVAAATGFDPHSIGIWFGAISTLTILGHLAGDLITPMGVWPFRPVSDWHHTFDITPAKNPQANQLCFGAGVIALSSALVLVFV